MSAVANKCDLDVSLKQASC